MKRITSSVILFSLLFLASCSKYEDGPWISFRNQMNRLQGVWQLKYFTVDGVDSLQYWNEYFGNECKFIIGPYDDKVTDYGPITIEWGDSLSSKFYIVNTSYQGFSKDLLIIYGEVLEDSSSSAFPLSFLGTKQIGGIYWTISRLKYNELWFQVSVNDKQYDLHLDIINKF